MAYSDFSLEELKAQFGIELSEEDRLFADVPPVAPSVRLLETLAENVPLASAIDTEKARSEFIIAPLLAECRRLKPGHFSLFSGIDFTVDSSKGLSGQCDFILSRSPEQLYLSAPVVMLVEAKNHRIKEGIAQCAAEMIAAQRFNLKRGALPSPIYGAVTTGNVWRFLSLTELKIAIDRDEYHINDAGRILGVLLHMLG
jgi:hypothetical protein